MVVCIRRWRPGIGCELRMRWEEKKMGNGVRVRDGEDMQNEVG